MKSNTTIHSTTKFISSENKNTNNQFVVLIGASAGGLEAIHEFFDYEGNAKHVSFVVIQHLSPDHKSLLVELVSKHTNMTVLEAGEGMELLAGHVYIIPNNKLITIHNNKFKLNDKRDLKLPNTAIDTFLFSLATDKGNQAIAIILSGTGSDGTKGIEAIKNAGGTVIVQDPSSAKFDGMPNNAIISGNIDYVLEPKEMPTIIDKIIKTHSIKTKDISSISDSQMEKIFTLIYNHSGHDFNYYKTPTIIRRIEKRMGEKGIDKLNNYIKYLEDNDDEVKNLGEDFLIGVTAFFRDKPAFDLIYQDIIPDLLKNKNNKDILKVWVCACSTGEEAYSLAILIDKCMQNNTGKPEIKIFATDIDENSLKIAQKGEYPLSISKEIDPNTLSEYFIRNETHYTIIPRIRRQIVFAMHNVIKNPPFIKNDLVSCRNMLIYLTPILQRKLLGTFHFSLNEGGYLFLGSSESANYIKEGVIEISAKNKIYKKTNGINFLTKDTNNQSFIQKIDKFLNKNNQIRDNNKPELYHNEDFHKLLLEDLNYVGIIIDTDFNIKDSFGDYKRYLSLPEKKLNFNILKMVSLEISGSLSTAIRKAKKTGETIVLHKELQDSFRKNILCRIVVKPLHNKNLTLIVFSTIEERESTSSSLNNDITLLTEIKQNEYIQELETELSEAKSDLQGIMEEMETANEELQSSNEELLSANEELQSSNEELQSLNEELHTLNAEHQVKIKELTELNDDLDNYFRNTDLAQLFVDRDLRVRKFNPAAIQIINLITSDIGRPLTHISTNLVYDNLIEDLKAIINEDVQTIEKEVILKNGTKRMLKISPYLRQDKVRDGAVISFVDISVFEELNNIIKSAFNASKSAIIAYKSIRDKYNEIIDFRYLTGNSTALNLLDIPQKDVIHQSIRDQIPQISGKNFFKSLTNVVNEDTTFQIEYRISETTWYELVAVKMLDGFVLTIIDISDKKIASNELKENYENLVLAKNSLRELNSGLESEIKERKLELDNTIKRRQEEFENIFTNSPFHIIIKRNKDLVYDFINKEALEFYNLYEAIGKPSSQVKLHWEGANLSKKEQKVLKTGKAISEKNHKISYQNKATKSEIVCWFDYTIEPIFDNSKKIVGIIIFAIDVTDRIRAQKETDLLLEQKDEFLSIASHELKTPLTSIKAFIQILESRTKNDESLKPLNELAKKSGNQINRLANLINDLLDVTKIRTNKLRLNPSSFNAKDLIKDSLEGFDQYTDRILEVKTNDDIMLHADKNMLEQVVNNLISNALKYSSDQDKIIIKSEIKNSMYYFSVEDFGIGIPSEKIDYIFQRFFRANESTVDYSAGIGLGLYIASEIVKKHKGRIHCKSTLGKGSLFWFTIPVVYIS